jgi:hypothetical protein
MDHQLALLPRGGPRPFAQLVGAHAVIRLLGLHRGMKGFEERQAAQVS